MFRTCALAASLLALAACTTPISFAELAVESLPQVAEPADGLTSGRSIAAEGQLRNLFRQECFMPGQANYCPAGVDVSGGMASPFKFTSQTLLGLIYHAELYSGGLRSACTGRQVSLTPANLVTTAPSGDGMRFMLDTLGQYTCAEVERGSGQPRHQAYSVAADYQSTLTLDYRYDEGGGATRTAIWQVYTGLDSRQVPAVLAFNYAAVSGYSGRAVLLVNLKTHRFAIRYLTAPPPGATKYHFVTAIGVGGVDRGSGAGHPGYYFATYSSDEGPMAPDKSSCVDNATQLIEVDDTECRKAGVPVGWTDSAEVATWLGLGSADQGRLAPFLAKFSDSGLFAQAETPTGEADIDLLFPARIE